MAKLDDVTLRELFGDWAVALAGKSRGMDAGAWFSGDIGEDEDPKSVGHEHTFNTDTADQAELEGMLARLSQMVCRRLREYGLHARTINLKLRYSDFTTITRAHTLDRSTQIDTEMFEEARALFRKNWRPKATVRLLGVQASSLEHTEGQISLLTDDRHEKWKQALSAADKLRDKFGDGTISLASGLKSNFRERTHENPAALPGKRKPGTEEPKK
jgi:DNA polymerase IV